MRLKKNLLKASPYFAAILLVADFGDFPLYNVSKLLQVFAVSEEYLETYVDGIFDLIRGSLNWVDLTGGEFVVDTKMFRLGYKVTVHS